MQAEDLADKGVKVGAVVLEVEGTEGVVGGALEALELFSDAVNVCAVLTQSVEAERRCCCCRVAAGHHHEPRVAAEPLSVISWAGAVVTGCLIVQ